MSLTIKNVLCDPYKYIISCDCHKCDMGFAIEYINEKHCSIHINNYIYREAVTVLYEALRDHMQKKHRIDFILTGGI